MKASVLNNFNSWLPEDRIEYCVSQAFVILNFQKDGESIVRDCIKTKYNDKKWHSLFRILVF
jgi:hypothetical protein